MEKKGFEVKPSFKMDITLFNIKSNFIKSTKDI